MRCYFEIENLPKKEKIMKNGTASSRANHKANHRVSLALALALCVMGGGE